MPNELSTVTAVFDELSNVTPDSLVNQLHTVFGKITQMKADEAVAAYQTLATIEEIAPQKEARAAARHLKLAVAAQMNHIVLEDPFSHNRVRLKSRFREMGVKVSAPDSPY